MRLACLAVLAACGDNAMRPPACTDTTPAFARVVPLHTNIASARDLVLAGTFSGALDLGATAVGGTDVFLATLDAGGAPRSAHAYGDDQDQELRVLAAAGDGSIAIAGRFTGEIDFGGGPLVAQGTSSLFVASFDPAGALRFARTFPVEAIVHAIAISSRGDVAVAGSSFDPVDFGGGTLPSGAQFLAVLDAGGNHVTSRRLATEDISTNLDVGLAFARDDLLVAGSFTSSIDLGAGALASAGGVDFYVARFGRDGVLRSARRFGGAGNDGYEAFDGDRLVIAAAADDVVVAGTYTGSIELAEPSSTADDEDDVFVMRLDAGLAPIWSRTFDHPGYQAVGALAIGDAGEIALAGTATGGTVTGDPAACGDGDASHAFATTLDAGGDVRWTACFAADFAAALGLAWRGDDVVLAGTFAGTLGIGAQTLAADGLAGFVAGVRPTCP